MTDVHDEERQQFADFHPARRSRPHAGDRDAARVSRRRASPSVRLDEPGWVLPNLTDRYGSYPPVRHVPSYDKTTPVRIGGAARRSRSSTRRAPTRLNPARASPAIRCSRTPSAPPFARVRNISISRVTIEDADPRYPILIAGLVDHPIENVTISDVSVQYRGGLTMAHAVEQRQINQPYAYTAYQAAPATQSLPWLVNTFFAKNEALLPRIGWDAAASGGRGGWTDDPYNVPGDAARVSRAEQLRHPARLWPVRAARARTDRRATSRSRSRSRTAVRPSCSTTWTARPSAAFKAAVPGGRAGVREGDQHAETRGRPRVRARSPVQDDDRDESHDAGRARRAVR